ncbi:zinc finger protein 82 homolog [Microplitis demolitor]|uniref:zinc finger protein 82 homolog n=1 Tax=Microplitis demolitor TaxID=69319 RepID=UPI0004CCE8AD|nr:zinc finger protein 82 homolog [Microplitis demolitor]
MNFSEQSGIQGLPQFSELNPRSNFLSNSNFTSTSAQLLAGQNSVYTTSDPGKQSVLANNANKYPGSLLAWSNSNALMQLCEKQAIQTISIPNYSQNNSLLGGMPSNSLPVRLLSNVYLPTTSQADTTSTIKSEEVNSDISNSNISNNDQSHSMHLQSATMAEYLQKLQATKLPLTTLQQLIKFQTEPTKKDKADNDDERTDQPINNILNIPSVAGFRNNLQNGNQYLNSDQLPTNINPIDLNIHIESDPMSSSSSTAAPIQQPIKVEQQIQTDSPKTERKVKFRAKLGEIKITTCIDGSLLYCCPECSMVFQEKSEIDQHIQIHLQERKYQCKECGAMLKRKEHLDQHMRGHSDERPFKCLVCQKAFKRNEHLTRHFVIHSGDKNFTCNICQKAFSRKDHLNKHTQTHLGIRRGKSKKDSVPIEIKETIESMGDISKHDLNYILKDGTFIKQEQNSFLQHIQNLHKDQQLSQTFSVFKEQALKENGIHQQPAVNMNEILPQNTRYLMPS